MNTARHLPALCGAMLAASALLACGAEPIPVVSVVATDDYAAELSVPGITNLGLFTFTRVGDVAAALTVHFSLSGTATPLVDYHDLSDSITFPPGQSSVTLAVKPIYTRTVEPAESVILSLLPDTTHEISAASHATVNIWHTSHDDPALPTVVVWSDGSGGEHIYPGGYVNTVAFSFYRDGQTNQELTIEFTLGGTAVPGVDYTGGLSGLVTFPAGTEVTYVHARPVADGLAEGSETVLLTLNASPRYQIGSRSSAQGNITDDETSIAPAINRGWLAMPARRLTFRVNGPPTQNFLIHSSTNLVDWTLASPTPVPGGGDFIEPATGAHSSHRFFRAVPQ